MTIKKDVPGILKPVSEVVFSKKAAMEMHLANNLKQAGEHPGDSVNRGQ
ncbi:hypothetical protein N8703_03760 [Verrucomicrobia bacterium]|nr:hypothetical protein [Verrucomicrobiota bacterium]